jgi:hypothetical protein
MQALRHGSTDCRVTTDHEDINAHDINLQGYVAGACRVLVSDEAHVLLASTEPAAERTEVRLAIAR